MRFQVYNCGGRSVAHVVNLSVGESTPHGTRLALALGHMIGEGKPLVGLDLSGGDFAGMNLKSQDFHRCDMAGANLWKTDLTGANLAMVNGVISMGHTAQELPIYGWKYDNALVITAEDHLWRLREARTYFQHKRDRVATYHQVQAIGARARALGWETRGSPLN